MSSGEKSVNIVNLLSSFNLEIKNVPDNLKCTKCKFVLKDAYQMVCGCRFCRVCIDDLQANGVKFCSGGSDECDETPLSTTLPDYCANKSISKLIAKCPHVGCSYECVLTSLKDHMLVCPKKLVNCPFCEIGCQQNNMVSEDMSQHLQQNSRKHNKILIEMVVNINTNMDILRRELVMKDEQVIHVENDIKSITYDLKSIKDQIKLIEYENKSIKEENKSIKDLYQLLKNENELIKIGDQLNKNEINSIKNENKLIKEVIKIVKNQNESMKKENKLMKNEQKSIRDEIKSIRKEMKSIKDGKENIQSIKDDNNSTKFTFQLAKSLHVPTVLVQAEAFEDQWVIDDDISKNSWCSKKSDCFTRTVYPYMYQLLSGNSVKSNGKLWIRLVVHATKHDPLVNWLLEGNVTVSEKGKRETHLRLSRQCQIERPPDDKYRSSEPLLFPHSELKAAGLDLSRGVCVSCQIICTENK